ncbi:MAG: hypothetical protein QXG05_05610 [Nitrososphaerota archaeon]
MLFLLVAEALSLPVLFVAHEKELDEGIKKMLFRTELKFLEELEQHFAVLHSTVMLMEVPSDVLAACKSLKCLYVVS